MNNAVTSAIDYAEQAWKKKLAGYTVDYLQS